MAAARPLIDPYQQEERNHKASDLRRKRRQRRISLQFKICFLAACCVALALFYLQQQVAAYYLNIEATQLQEQVNLLEQRNDRLMLSLESQRSLAKIEELAKKQLGMVVPERITNLVVESTLTPTGSTGGRWFDDGQMEAPGVFATVAAWFNRVFPLGGVEAGTL